MRGDEGEGGGSRWVKVGQGGTRKINPATITQKVWCHRRQLDNMSVLQLNVHQLVFNLHSNYIIFKLFDLVCIISVLVLCKEAGMFISIGVAQGGKQWPHLTEKDSMAAKFRHLGGSLVT